MKMNNLITNLTGGLLVFVIFSAYLLAGSEGKAIEPVDKSAENSLSGHIHDWEIGNWWVVQQVTNDSFISGVPEQSNTKLLKYEVLSKSAYQIKKKLANDNSMITYYVVRESHIGIDAAYRDLFYMSKNEKNKFLYKTETHYVLRGENTTDEEYYNTDSITLNVVTPLLAREMKGSNRRYEARTASYSEERGGKKHISGFDFGELLKVTVSDGTSVDILQLTDKSSPWPIYEKTNYMESELLDYSGWHELGEEALTKIPQSNREKAKKESRIFLSENDE